jgi:hypothetical protein
MVQLQQPFNAHAVAPQSRPEAIDDGWYPGAIVASEIKPTQAGDGGYLEFVFEIIDGIHKGKKQYARLNIYNQNEQAVQIAVGNLSAICHSVGVYEMQDTQQLHNRPLQIYVVKRRNERDGGMTNEVKGFRDINGNEPWKGNQQQQPQGAPQSAPQQPQQPPQQPAQPPAGAPWGGQPQQPEQPAQGGWQGQQQPPSQVPAGNGQWGAPAAPAAPPQASPAPGWQGGTPPNAPPWGNR